MERFGQHIRRIVYGILCIGMSVQIVLGLCWVVLNIGHFQEFGDSLHYIEISKTFVCDEYFGILYPLFIWIVMKIQIFTFIPYYCILYIVQLVTAFYASYSFLLGCRIIQPFTIKKISFKGVWGCLCVLTIPMLMQCHLAVLPHSLTVSLFLILISMVLKILNNPKEMYAKSIIKMVPFWLAMSLLMPEYKLLAGVPIFFAVIYVATKIWKSNKDRVRFHAIAFIVSLGLILAISSLTQTPGSYGRMKKTCVSTAVSRFVWPWFYLNYNFWPWDVKEVMDVDASRNISWHPDNVINEFGPLLENHYGIEKAQELYLEMIKIASNIHTKDIVIAMGRDALSYSAPPIMFMKSLADGGYESYFGRNYEIMKAQRPGLTKEYIHFSNWWFVAGIVLSVILLLCSRQKIKWKQPIITTFVLLTACVIIAYYTLSGAGIMDYKNSIFIMMLWYGWMLKIIKENSKHEQCFKENNTPEVK